MLNDDGSIDYRGYTLMVSDTYVHVWQGAQFVDTVMGEPAVSLMNAKRLIDEWHAAR